MPRAVAGVLVECDPSIKAIIAKLDKEHQHEFIIEEIDDEHILVHTKRHDDLKKLLKEHLRDTVKEADESSGSE